MGSELAFFKFVWSSEYLEIPHEFMFRVGGSLPAKCLLRDCNRNLWLVEAARRGDGFWCFTEGWSDFFTRNSIELRDLLEFEYTGDNLFDFVVLGHDACDKPQLPPNLDEDEQANISDEQQEVATFGARTMPHKRSYKKQNTRDCYGEDIFESSLVPRPNNPYFVTRWRPLCRKNELYIPKDVIVDYGLDIPEKMFLVDERGRKWETKVKQWKDGRLWCTGGWKSLCNVNRVGINDTCVCEFVNDTLVCKRARAGEGDGGGEESSDSSAGGCGGREGEFAGESADKEGLAREMNARRKKMRERVAEIDAIDEICGKLFLS
ncbi:Unknown protein [Striga hermonthica]|uniref:TF-B3 domain-containing protein n=1 Tax=Striga hermonthica TaxID=68872 RepID=A0A9N7RBW1_STRHE|nr:Unknown protein [Striga hermonthica]